jgi:hypothetical protein
LTALAFRKEVAKRSGERFEEVMHDIRLQKTSRIMSLLNAIKNHELGERDSDVWSAITDLKMRTTLILCTPYIAFHAAIFSVSIV